MGHGLLRCTLLRQHKFAPDAYEHRGPERTQYGT